MALGVEHEEAAGKWRAGDASKSLRFFHRAIEVYDQGLSLWPGGLDLAYNKARVQLEVVTHPVLLRVSDVPALQGLEVALTSHRYALGLDGGWDDENTLFNTAQVLTAIAEELSKQKDGDGRVEECLKLLEEALELQGRCLSIQEMKFEGGERQTQMMQEQSATTQEQPTEPATEQEEGMSDVPAAQDEDQWFSVVEPVTLDTLMDTVLAQLGTLTTLCSVLSSATNAPPSPSLHWITDFFSTLHDSHVSKYPRPSNTSQLQEIALSKANFQSAFLEASFHQGAIDASTFELERDNAFKTPEQLLDNFPNGLIANAQSLISFSSTLADDPSNSFHAATRWRSLSSAIKNLATASKLPSIDAEQAVKTHLLRGEASFLLWQLSRPPINLPTAVSNATQLLKNADVFYRNASRLATDEAEKAMAGFRSSMAIWLQQSGSDLQAMLRRMAVEKGEGWVRAQLTEMVDESLLPDGII